MPTNRDRRAKKRSQRAKRTKKSILVEQLGVMLKHAFWKQQPDPEFPAYNLVTFRVYGSPMPIATYRGSEAMKRVGRFVENFSKGWRDGGAGESSPENERWAAPWELETRMHELRDDACKKATRGMPTEPVPMIVIGRWRFGLSLELVHRMWTFSAQLVDESLDAVTIADEQRFEAATLALKIPVGATRHTMAGRTRYRIWPAEVLEQPYVE